MRNDIRLRFQSNPTKDYEAVVGTAILTEEFSETLDSFACVIDDVEEKDRLLKAKPFERVLVWNAGDGYPFKRMMLLDSMAETRTDNADGTYRMSVSLMSETKLLEKIQLPNVSISHYTDGSSPSILGKIDDFMTLWCPKWNEADGAKPIIKWDVSEGSELYGKFHDVDASDMSMTAPTLRQALTNLMLQKGCIPQVKDGELSFLDFRSEQGEFLDYSTITSQVRSVASDSYATDLVSSAKNVLDDGNEVLSETVGFRDRDNVILKNLENLQIETRLPIYSVKRCVMCYPLDFKIELFPENSYLYTNGNNLSDGDPIAICGWDGRYSNLSKDKEISDGSASDMELMAVFHGVNDFQVGSLYNLKIHFCRLAGEHYFKELAETTLFLTPSYTLGERASSSEASYTRLIKFNDQGNQSGWGDKVAIPTSESTGNPYIGYRIPIAMPTEAEAGGWDHLWIEATYIRKSDSKRFDIRIPLSPRDSAAGTVKLSIYDSDGADVKYIYTLNGVIAADITPNVSERAKREILETDYTKMLQTSLSEISAYRYGTVSYAIGERKITGFSDNWSEAVAWWSSQKSLIEVLWDTAEKANEIGIRAEWGYAEGDGIIGNWTGLKSMPQLAATNFEFSKTFFDVSYQPLNTLTFTATKTVDDDIPFPIEQADNQDSGTTDFDRLADYESDKADRIGNETLAIAQVSDTGNDVNGLNSLFGTKVCFKRQICFEDSFISVSYQLSEKAILRNYFTAITTKYRAYEYIDYSSSIVRKERDRAYLLIYDLTDERGRASGKVGLSNAFKNLFWQGWRHRDEDGHPWRIRSVVEGGYGEDATRNEVSAMTWKNGFVFNYEQYDNVSAGTYLPTGEIDKTIGGIRQKWQTWGDGFRERRCVWLYSHLPIMGMKETKGDTTPITDLPKVHYEGDLFEKWKELSEPYRLLWLGGESPEDEREYRQDNAELINETIQLDLWCPSGAFAWTERFLRNTPLTAYEDDLTSFGINLGKEGLLDTLGQDDNANLPQTAPWFLGEGDAGDIISEYGNGFIAVNWDNAVVDGEQMDEIKVTAYDPNLRKRVDVCGFRRNGKSISLLSLKPCDVRTLRKVHHDADGLPYMGD